MARGLGDFRQAGLNVTWVSPRCARDQRGASGQWLFVHIRAARCGRGRPFKHNRIDTLGPQKNRAPPRPPGHAGSDYQHFGLSGGGPGLARLIALVPPAHLPPTCPQ